MVTPNIDEEASMMEDVGMQDVHFNEVRGTDVTRWEAEVMKTISIIPILFGLRRHGP